jgi:hypothetical protein
MDNNWVKVYTTENPYSAEIIKQGLIESEIPAVVLNKQDSSYKVFGVLEVMVSKEHFDKALTYIVENNIE